MGLMESLRALLGGSKAGATTVAAGVAAEPVEDAVEEEVAVERVQDDIESERLAALERAIDTPSAMDEER